MIKLDYSLKTPEERLELVKKILEENPNPNSSYLEILANYLIFCMEKEEKKEKKILTENRLATVNKRETSYEGLVSQFENGEDGVYNITNNDKHVIFQPKISITKKDREDIPELSQTDEAIAAWGERLKRCEGRDAYIAKTAQIEARKDQYVIKQHRKPPVQAMHLVHSEHYITLPDETWIDEDDNVVAEGVTLTNPLVCSIILCNYSKLRQNCYGDFFSDTWYLMEEFDKVSLRALRDKPLYYRLVECKIDGLQNVEIQEILEEEFGVKHSLEYISSLWRNKIPNLIASAAEDDFLDWYYLNVEKGKYKRCSRCGEIKLAHNKYFSKNKTSKDGFYSICKECRNKKKPKFEEDGQNPPISISNSKK